MKMSEQEANEYLENLMKNRAVVTGVEVNALEEWKRLTSEITKVNDALIKAKSEVDHLTSALYQMNGGRQTLLRLLIVTEEERRAVKAKIEKE